jgi:hypothetical protein
MNRPATVHPTDSSRTCLATTALSDSDLADVVAAVVGRPVRVLDWATAKLPVSSGAISTESVTRLHGTATDGASHLRWSVLVKVLRSARHWPGISMVPPPFRQRLIDDHRWQREANVLTSELPSIMPTGMRTPRVYRCDDLGDDRLAVWMEWVDVVDSPWDGARFRRAARLLGQLAARRRIGSDTATTTAEQLSGLRELYAGPLARRYLPMLRDHGLRSILRPYASAQLREDLDQLSEQIPAMLDRLAGLPQAVGHGDACPQNLLIPAEAPNTVVAIDLSWQHPEAIGFDLGQLLIGLAHTGDLAADELPALHDDLLAAFVDGLRTERCDVDIDDVRYGFDAAMVIRSAFTSLPWDQLQDQRDPEFVAHLVQRVALTRYLAGVGLALPRGM